MSNLFLFLVLFVFINVDGHRDNSQQLKIPFVSLLKNKHFSRSEPSNSNVEVSPVTEECLKQHNIYRSKHGSPNLSRDQEAEDYALKRATHMAQTGDFSHDAGKYGENLYLFMMNPPNKLHLNDSKNFGKSATDSWYSEIKDYNFDKPGFSSATGHFTQVVWKSTIKFGCAGSAKDNKVYVVCNYTPPGNFQGQFEQNVKRANN